MHPKPPRTPSLPSQAARDTASTRPPRSASFGPAFRAGERLRAAWLVAFALTIALALLAGSSSQSTAAPPAETAPERCSICSRRLDGPFFWFSSPALTERQAICDVCHKLETRCHLCRLPVDRKGQSLPDGRHLCPQHAEAGVFEERTALRIYEEMRRDVQGLLAGTGTIPGRNIRVSLVDAQRLRALNQTLPSAHDDGNILGLTRTRVLNGTSFEHEIFLLSGLPPARLAAVAAHEFTHAWIHENVPRTRQLDRDSVEGFCELVAYKLMNARNEAMEKQVILANAYTRGQINAFVQAEEIHQFHRIVRWLKTGVDDALIVSNANQVLAVRPSPESLTPVWPPPPQRLTSVPDQLELRGLSGPNHRRLALINDTTFAPGDRAKVRTGTGSLLVRCLEIRPGSTVVQIEGESHPRELHLRHGAGIPPTSSTPSAAPLPQASPTRRPTTPQLGGSP